jgi:hypothetical protein
MGENRMIEFKSPSENPVLFPGEGGRGMSSKAAAIKNNVHFNLTLSSYAAVVISQRTQPRKFL